MEEEQKESAVSAEPRQTFDINEKVKAKEKLAFCSGDIFCGGNQAMISVIYLVFLTNIVGIDPGIAGTIIMVSKIWDAITDPMVGLISDNTRSKFGRRRPFIFLAGLLIIPAIAFMWYPVAFPSAAGKAAYVAISYIFYYTVSTLVTVPYSALSTEITPDVDQRSKINLTRLLFSLSSTAICTLVPSLLFEMVVKKGTLSANGLYLILTFGFGTFFTIPVILCAIFSKERAPYNQEKAHFSMANFIKPFKIKAFRKLLIMYLAQSITMDITSSVIIYYALYVVKGFGSTVFLGIFLGVQLIMFPVINSMVTKKSKTKIYGAFLPVAILGAAGIGFYPSNWPVWGLYIIAGVTALGFVGAMVMPWIIFPDVVDIGTMGLKERITGSFSGAMTFIRKISSALAALAIGWVLSLTGYVTPTTSEPNPTQPDATIWGIRLIIFFAFLILMGIAYFVCLTFKLTPEISKKVKLINDKEEKGEDLSEEEKQDKEKIAKEFI
jgi:Na+/melibiose symporter-like transporter